MDIFHSLSKRILFFSLLLLHLLYAAQADFNIATIPFNKGYYPLFGDNNVVRSSDDKSVNLVLNQYTGSGFKSSDLYNHGFFSAKIKLPSDYTAGIVVAFYRKKGGGFRLMFMEMEAQVEGEKERYYLWFDPSREFHRYSILWTSNNIIFYIDNIPIREIVRSDAMGGDFPSKPMSLYATIWDASNWATSGGKYKVNYKYSPFVAKFTDLALDGCAIDPIQDVLSTSCSKNDDQLKSANYATITPKQRSAMKKFRQKYMYYSYCYDIIRYPIAPPECVIDPVERHQFKDTGRLNFGSRRHRHDKIKVQVSSMRTYEDQQDED
ncbi:xyloglucan endotransglucosylase/hydrolase 30 [Actinidia rufa]|uniref:Xyloglucan endotransglucosylase/hydrolase n=1 Tax=Actinidia rufa TaxID=165716 RepID=A0A7J0F086_9ERIC|nr:xyloglucan endotransglucosylase/hydrolase 30 [Actinidia rufa]